MSQMLRIGVIFFVFFISDAAYTQPVVLSSIKPLTLIAQEITGSLAQVDTLLPANASHHDYPLKLSDYVRLKKADVIIWVGPELESFLQKPVANIPNVKIITAYELAGIYWPNDNQTNGFQNDHHHYEHDPHVWLDPRNAVVIARALEKKLIQIDVANTGRYRQNLQAFETKMDILDKKLQTDMKPLVGLGFAVFHEGFSHFVNRYGLNQLDYVTFTPEQKPGARHLSQLRNTLAKEGQCLFLEPYNETQSARDLAQELHLRTGLLDALGTQGALSYTQLLEQIANAFSTCLANGSDNGFVQGKP